MKKTVLALTVAVAFIFVASISSAAVTVLDAGQSTVCVQSAWIAYNTKMSKETPSYSLM